MKNKNKKKNKNKYTNINADTNATINKTENANIGIDTNRNLNSIINLIDTKYFNKITGILTIPEGIEVINGDFYYHRTDVEKIKKVKGINIPNSVNTIGKYAFRRTDISSIELPESVKEIELGAFELCTNLIEVSVKGDKVPIIQKDAFIVCENLEKFYNYKGDISIRNDLRISNQAFSTCYKLLNAQNKWLMVVPEKENKFQKIINKIMKSIGKLFNLNGTESIKSKF